MSEEEKRDKITNLLVEMSDLRRELQEFEASQSALFDQTAENRAKNKTIMWWVLQLAHIEKHNEVIFFTSRANDNCVFIFDDYPKYNISLIWDMLKHYYDYEQVERGKNKIVFQKHG